MFRARYGYAELFDAAVSSNLQNVVLQTGKIDPGTYASRRPDRWVISFTDKFNELIAGSQVVVTPPGGTPVEAAAYGKPVVIMPYPGWTRAADKEKTILFVKKLKAVLLERVNSRSLEDAIQAARKGKPKKLVDGVGKLVEAILEIAEKSY